MKIFCFLGISHRKLEMFLSQKDGVSPYFFLSTKLRFQKIPGFGRFDVIGKECMEGSGKEGRLWENRLASRKCIAAAL